MPYPQYRPPPYGNTSGYQHGTLRFACRRCEQPFWVPRVTTRRVLCQPCHYAPRDRICVDCGVTFQALCAKYCPECRDTRVTARQKAMIAVARAVKDGLLPRVKTQACVDCGKPAADYDHRDYSRPLDVAPTCRRCNLRRGPAARPLAIEAAPA